MLRWKDKNDSFPEGSGAHTPLSVWDKKVSFQGTKTKRDQDLNFRRQEQVGQSVDFCVLPIAALIQAGVV